MFYMFSKFVGLVHVFPCKGGEASDGGGRKFKVERVDSIFNGGDVKYKSPTSGRIVNNEQSVDGDEN